MINRNSAFLKFLNLIYKFKYKVKIRLNLKKLRVYRNNKKIKNQN